jgi:dipeptidyl-peptidase-3
MYIGKKGGDMRRFNAMAVVIVMAGMVLGGCGKGCSKGGGPGPVDAEIDAGAEAGSGQAAAGEKTFMGEIERLGQGEKSDYLVVALEAPSFKDLALEQKLLAYWLSMAAIAGNDIMYLQNHRFALDIKTMLEDVYRASDGGGMGEVREGLLEYLKYVWINHGQYDHRSSVKFVPGRLTREQLLQITTHAMERGAKLEFLEGSTAEEKLAPLLPHIFDPELEKRITVTDPGVDVIAESHGNLYDEGIGTADLEKLDGQWLKRLNVRFALQEGKVVPQVFKVGCVYDQHIKRVAAYLKKARPYAPEGDFRDSLDLLLKFYETGDEELYRQHSIEWIGLSNDVEYVNGFIEQLKDPRGVIGSFEGMSAVKADSAVVDRIIADSLAFEAAMPWPDVYKRDKVEKATATIVEVVTGTGDMGPVPWGGFNLPNYDDIRRDYGSKNVILVNILNSYSKKDRQKTIEEFYLDPYKPLVARYADEARKLIVYLHEIIGHGSGRAAPGLKDDPRNLMGRNFSSLEEARADLVALYHMGDPKFVEYGLLEAGEVEDFVLAGTVMYLTRHLIQMGSFEDNLVTEAHDRAGHLIFQYLETGGAMGDPKREKKDYGMRLVEKDGKHYVEITDMKKLRLGLADLLTALQTAKSTADVKAQDGLFDAMTVDAALCEEILKRESRLELAAQRVVVYPHLSLVRDGKGAIVDVSIRNDEDLTAQQLRWSSVNNAPPPGG